MYKIKVFNKISEDGLQLLRQAKFVIGEDIDYPDAVLLRSYKLHDEVLPESVLAVGRAGAGVNNIPVDEYTKKGIVVFNTPGANANAVKELVFTGMLLSARDILGGIQFAKEQISESDANISKIVEKNKSNFKGIELRGKKLGVIGLGAIGVLVANDAVGLGMDVCGYDPFISVSRAWGLSRSVKQSENLQALLNTCDFISLHMPLTDDTREFIDAKKIENMKKGAVLLNFSRSEIVNEKDIVDGVNTNQLGRYVTDFPTKSLLTTAKVICMPHLGASTMEAENNCSLMISKQMQEFLLNGNIENSVNFPECVLSRNKGIRLTIMNRNVPNMVSQITGTLADKNLNILEMVNKSKKDMAYTIVDVDKLPDSSTIDAINQIEGVISTRVIK